MLRIYINGRENVGIHPEYTKKRATKYGTLTDKSMNVN